MFHIYFSFYLSNFNVMKDLDKLQKTYHRRAETAKEVMILLVIIYSLIYVFCFSDIAYNILYHYPRVLINKISPIEVCKCRGWGYKPNGYYQCLDFPYCQIDGWFEPKRNITQVGIN